MTTTIYGTNPLSKYVTVKLVEICQIKAIKEKIKPYYIFNDAQMEDIIAKNPKTKEELLQVSGFGNVKVEKYGEEIVGILKG